MLSHPIPSAPARRRRPALPSLLLALLGLCALGHAASANTLNVPSAYPTIQSAISASVSGDTVLIADGTYTGPGNVDVDFLGKNLTVTSQNGAAHTVIDCGGFSSTDGSGDHRGFILQSGETSAVISGLTIQNGYESGHGGGDGGGIKISGADVTVQNCVLQNNTAQYGGGGLFNYGGTATLTNDTLTGDTVQSGAGGGLTTNTGTVALTGCALTGDTAQYGGGLANGGTVTLTGCALTGDTASLGGGGLANFGGTATLTNDVLASDTAQYGGGGLYNQGGTVTLTNDTLTGNALTGSAAPNGGGLLNGGTAMLTNDILYGDSGGELNNAGSSTASATHCDIGGGVPSGTTDGGGNINADPRFVNPPSDLHLRAGSPCLGAGTSDGAPTTTLDGYPRPDPPSIGAYEPVSSLTVPGQYATIQSAISASVSGDTVLIADGTYTGPGNVDVDFLGKNITVTSQNGAAHTVIDCGGFSSTDGSGDHRGFILHSGETSAVIRGLTIENGYESGNGNSDGQGGGIEVRVAGVTVLDCVFQNNTALYGGGLLILGTATLTNCALTDNAARFGGGLYNDGTATLTNCVVAGDTALYYGGGLYNGEFGSGTATLTNCALTGNAAQYGGGGLVNGGTATLTNDILYGDTAKDNSGEFYYSGGGTASATHCDIEGGVPSGTVTDGGGNISADPKFVNPPADLHLRAGSPCLGAGTPNGAPTTTLDGRTRPNPPSIGAYELGTAFRVFVVNATSAAGQTVLLSAALARPGGVGLAGATLTFTVDGQPAGSGVANRNGDASVHYAVPLSLSLGSHTITASFSGDGMNPASSGTATLTVTAARLPNSIIRVGVRSGPAGATVVLKSTLKTPSGAALPGRTLSYTVNGVSAGSAATDGAGLASLTYTIPANAPAGAEPVVVSFAGDSGDAPSSGKGTLTVH